MFKRDSCEPTLYFRKLCIFDSLDTYSRKYNFSLVYKDNQTRLSLCL